MTVDTTPKKILDKINSSVAVTATDLDIRNLSSATDSVTAAVTGTVTATIQEPLSVDDNGSSLTVDQATATNLQGIAYTGLEGSTAHLLTTDAAGDLQVDVKTMPTTTVTATDLDIRDLTSTERTPLGSNGVALQQQATTNELKVREQGTLTVSATNFDIRDLTSASDSVEVKQSTAANLKAEVSVAAGTGLPSLDYGSTDAGTTWVPIKVGADGVQQVSQSSTKTHNVYSFWEYLVENGTFIARHASATNNVVDIYTVTAGKKLYISSLTITAYNIADVDSLSTIDDESEHSWVGVRTTGIIAMNSNQAAFAIPAVLGASATLAVVSPSASTTATGFLIGYEI